MIYLPIVFTLALHVLIFNRLPLQYDELVMYNVLKYNETWKLLVHLYTIETQQPLSYIWTKALMIISEESWLLRLPSLLFTLFLPFPAYHLARLYLNKEDSLKACVYLLLFLPVLLFSANFRPYMPFLFFTVMALYQWQRPDRKMRSLITTLFFLFFIHPVGSFLTFIVILWKLIEEKRSKNLALISILFISLGFILVLYLRANEIHSILAFSGSLIRTLLGFSFLLSGREFTGFILLLSFILFFKKMKSKETTFNFSRFWVRLSGTTLGVAVLLSLVFGKHIYPRHFIFLLPGFAILSIQLINNITSIKNIRRILFIFGCGALIYKGLIKDDIINRPFEIDSENISNKSREIAQNSTPIISCGNCFDYYLKIRNYSCVGGWLPNNYFDSYKEVVYIDLDYAQDKCNLGRINRKFEIEESFHFIGANVRKLKFK